MIIKNSKYKIVLLLLLAVFFMFISCIMLYHYLLFVFVSSPKIDLSNASLMKSEIVCYKRGMSEYNKILAGYSINKKGIMKPPLFFGQEKKALKIFLEEIEEHGINTDDCTFFVVGPVYSLYEIVGDWIGARNFLTHTLDFYNKESFEYEIINTLLGAVEKQLEKPWYLHLLRSSTKRINSYCQWYALEIFILFSSLSLFFLVLSLYFFMTRKGDSEEIRK